MTSRGSQLQSESRCARRSRLSRSGSVSSNQIPNIAGRCAILSERNPGRERATAKAERELDLFHLLEVGG